MKLVRYGVYGQEKPGILDNNQQVRDLSGVIPDVAGKVLSPDSLARLAAIDPHTLPLVDSSARLGACVGSVRNFICIGLNYKDHALEIGINPPREPIVFMKVTSAICGPHDKIIIPPNSQKTDWEAELGVVIGKAARYVTKENALDYVAGYCVVNDISERALQLEGTGQWMKGKSCETFAPIGPWLVTKDEIPDIQNLDIWLEVDGHRYQQSNTKEMIFGVADIISYLSHYCVLQAGDIISTGTPAGVGLGQKPQAIYLQRGQNIRLGIRGLGEQNLNTI